MHSERSKKSIFHIIVGGTIGNVTEWYNFLLYGYLASVISKLFFPLTNELVSLTLVFTVFALSFLARPIGGIFFGWLGDTYGRQHALLFSIVLMGVPTFLIGCLPTYQTIGIASPLLLSLLRILQGLSAGGEHTGSAVYVSEHAPVSHKTLWVSTVPASAAIGILISSLTALLLINMFEPATLLAWGWRVGYWIGTLLCIISFMLRYHLPETPSFKAMQIEKSARRIPIKVLFSDSVLFKKWFVVFGMASCWGVFYQILFIWMPTYLTQFQHLTHVQSLSINIIFIIIFAFLIVLVGYLADKMNRNLLLFISTLSLLVLAYPIFLLLSSGRMQQIYLAMSLFTLCFSLYIPTAFQEMVDIFPVQVRYTGLSFGFNMGLAIFGGTCPLIATWLIQISGSLTAPALYMMLTATAAFLIVMLGRSRRYE